jgi:hypothetical protein
VIHFSGEDWTSYRQTSRIVTSEKNRKTDAEDMCTPNQTTTVRALKLLKIGIGGRRRDTCDEIMSHKLSIAIAIVLNVFQR